MLVYVNLHYEVTARPVGSMQQRRGQLNVSMFDDFFRPSAPLWRFASSVRLGWASKRTELSFLVLCFPHLSTVAEAKVRRASSEGTLQIYASPTEGLECLVTGVQSHGCGLLIDLSGEGKGKEKEKD